MARTVSAARRGMCGGVGGAAVGSADTSGSGTRGTFDVTIPYPGGHGGRGKLVVFESSAKDGSRINVVPIPVTLAG